MPIWNTAFNVSPSGSDLASGLDTVTQDLKQAIFERVTKEHVMDLSSGAIADDGWHRAGSAKVYYTASAPTLRPDGTTSLNSADAGRLYVNSSTKKLQTHTGSAWADVTITQADYARALNPNIETITSTPATLTATTRVVLYGMSSDNAITIPAGMPDGTELTFIKVTNDAKTTTVYASGAETIEGAASKVICTNSTRRYDVCMMRLHSNVWLICEGLRHSEAATACSTIIGNSFTITVSESAPSGGNNGDVWIQV